MSRFICFTTQELSTCCHVTPLVRTTNLEGYAVLIVEFIEIVTLHDLVGKLSVRDTCFDTFLNRFLTHHVVNREVFTYVTQEINEADWTKPVIVVDHNGLVVTIFKIKETRELSLDFFNPTFNSFFGLQATFSIFKWWVTNQTCCTTNEGVRFVSSQLKSATCKDSDKVSKVETVCCWVITSVVWDWSLFKGFYKGFFISGLKNQATCF